MKRINVESISDSLQKLIKNKKMTALEMLIFYLKIEKNLSLKSISQKLCISHEMVRLHLKKIYSYIKEDLKNEDISK